MSRTLTSAMVDAITGQVVRPLIFFEGVFASGTVRMFSGYGEITWNSVTWTGGGDFVGLSPVDEVADIEAVSVTVSLSGFDSALVSIALSECRSGKSGKLWLGFLDASNALIADPVLLFEGRLDVPEISDEGESASISIRYESELVALERSRERRYTNQDQRNEFPDDRAFEFVESLQEKEIIWGRV